MEPIKSIGQLLAGDEQRDAIHVAIMPVVCGNDWLSPGARVKLAYGTANMVLKTGNDEKPIGIVDPFLRQVIRKGDTVWLFLMPGTIVGLRHHWNHPDVDRPPVTANDSERWLRAFADKWNFNYDEMMAEAQQHEGYVVADGVSLNSRKELAPGDEELFWRHIEKVTGKAFDDRHREDFGWSCSC